MARQKNAEKAAKEGQGGGGAAGMKARSADSSVHAAAIAERSALQAQREERERLKKEKEAAAERKAKKLAASDGKGALGGDDAAAAKKKKAAAAAAALAAAGGAPAPKKKKEPKAAAAAAADEAAPAPAGEVEEVAEPEVDADGKPVRVFHEVDIPERPPLSEEELAAVRASIEERERISAAYEAGEAATRAAAAEAEAVEKARAVVASKGAGWKVSPADFERILSAARSSAAGKAEAAEAATAALLDELLAAAGGSLLVRALVPDTKVLRERAIRAGAAAMAAAAAAGKAEATLAALESVLDAPPSDAAVAERVTTGVLSSVSRLAGSLQAASLLRFLGRARSLFGGESAAVGMEAALAVSALLRPAICGGVLAEDAEPLSLLRESLAAVKAASSAAEARAAAGGVGAAVGSLGAAAIGAHGVLQALSEALDSKSKEAAHAREAATLSYGALARALRHGFEPYGVPALPKLIKLLADKDKKVADAATVAAEAMIEGLSTLSVKAVVGALYEGMGVVGGGGRVRIECLKLAGMLATQAPGTMGPCLPECIPLVIECLNDSNAKVQTAAEEALPVLCSCVQNAEVASTLRDFIIDALKKPDKTFDCVEEVLMTTFCNPMDGTSLAFMMPIIIRGIKDANYELVKKSTVCASNLCALIKDSSDIAPFVPLLLPLLEKNVDHSSPNIREATQTARERLLEGAGDLVDPAKRGTAVGACVRDSLAAAVPSLPEPVATYLSHTCAALLEERLGGVVRVQNFRHAVPATEQWVSSIVEPYATAEGGALAQVATAAVENFKSQLPEEARAILAKSGDKDFALDMQNIILAFAGRVLLRKADVRFERGHRYGLIGQNGTGKTTLLNRLAAKDINGFPQELRTWYIRHEVLCDDGIDVRTFLKDKSPAKLAGGGDVDDAFVEATLDQVQFPEEYRAAFVNSLSGGWKMRMSVAISIMHEPELLLLDEPTNHLDRESIEWLTKHLLSLTGVTMGIVSHDYDFIDEVCTDVTHYDNGGQLGKPCRFVYYPMTFSEFQKLKPEIAAGLPRIDSGPPKSASQPASEVSGSEDVSELSESMSSVSVSESNASEGSGLSTTLAKVDEMIAAGLILPMNFPDPGKPEGIRTFRKPVMTLKKCSFKYPETDRYILKEVDATVTLGSRAVIVGGNGSGKSTFLKLLIGDLEPEEGQGEMWKHHALRLSYVAQQSLHHLEDHVTSTPIQYLQARFRQGLDAEVAKLKSIALTDDEKAEMEKGSAISAIVGRTTCSQLQV